MKDVMCKQCLCELVWNSPISPVGDICCRECLVKYWCDVRYIVDKKIGELK